MSKVGRRPISVPESVKVSLDGAKVRIEGPLGQLSLVLPPQLKLSLAKNVIKISPNDDDSRSIALWGTWRSLIANAVQGVSQGFTRELELVGIGYRAKKTDDKKLVLEVGYSHPVVLDVPEGLEVEVPENTRVVVRGIDKQKVGQFAAEVRAVRLPEPYKGKGIRYKDEEIKIKPGKTGAEA